MKSLRLLLLGLVVFGAAWLCAIAYWRVRGVMPDGAALLVWLVVVPLVALIALLLVRRWWKRRHASEEPGEADVGSDAPPLAVAAPEGRVIHVLGAALWLPMANDALRALADDAPRPGLHPKIRDRDGLPVFAAFVEDLETGAVEDALRPQHDGAAFDAAMLRAVALLEPVAETLLVQIASAMPTIVQSVGTVNAGLQRRADADVGHRLQVSLLLPSSWPDAARAATGDWLRAVALGIGIDSRQLQIDVHGVRGADASWRFIESRITAHGGDDGGRTWHLLLACESMVDARSIARLDASGELLRSQRPEGHVPGEGASGLWIAAADHAVGVPAIALHPICRASVDSVGSRRVAVHETSALMAQALEAATTSHDAITWIISDTDQHRRRSSDVVAAASHTVPDLDIALRYRPLTALSGELGIVTPLALLAVGAGAVVAGDTALLAVSISGEHHRACVLGPVPSPSSHADATSSAVLSSGSL